MCDGTNVQLVQVMGSPSLQQHDGLIRQSRESRTHRFGFDI